MGWITLRQVAGLALSTAALHGCGANLSSSLHGRSASENFRWGNTTPPELNPPGPGAGEWNSELPTLENIMLAKAAKGYLASPGAAQRYGVEAAGTFGHYFDNDGRDYSVALERLLKAVPRVANLYEVLIAELEAAAVTFLPGQYQFSMHVPRVSAIERSEDENWYLAVNGFSYWISGSIAVDDARVIGKNIVLHLWDRYDWDPGVEIPINTPLGPITVDQERVGEFHRQGLAKEFSTVAQVRAP